MKNYRDSEVFQLMNRGNAIMDQLALAVGAVDTTTILNPYMRASLTALKNTYKERITAKLVDAVNDGSILICSFPIQKRFPANIPFIRVKRNNKVCIIVDLTKYAVIDRGGDIDGPIIKVTCDIVKLHCILISAYAALEIFNGTSAISYEVSRIMSYLWASMFNKVLKAQRVFVSNKERYEAFMYLAMKFFLRYYTETPPQLIEKITSSYIGNTKSNYLQFVESNLVRKDVDMFESWKSFITNIFSNDVTNLKSVTGGLDMTPEFYVQSFSMSMGKDGAYLALWSADYFFYCLLATYDRSFILNDKNWEEIVQMDKSMYELVSAITKSL